jgi:hypothetical protein
MIDAFANERLARTVDLCLDLITVSHRRISIGIDCYPCCRIERSIFDSFPRRITSSLPAHGGIDMNRLDFGWGQTSRRDCPPWNELQTVIKAGNLIKGGNDDRGFSMNQIFISSALLKIFNKT